MQNIKHVGYGSGSIGSYAFGGESKSSATCPTVPKYSGDTITLESTPRDGTGPYYVEFRINGDIIDASRLGEDNPITSASEDTPIVVGDAPSRRPRSGSTGKPTEYVMMSVKVANVTSATATICDCRSDIAYTGDGCHEDTKPRRRISSWPPAVELSINAASRTDTPAAER